MTSSKHALFIFIALIIVMLLSKPPQMVFSSSSFVRQEINDGSGDWILGTRNLPLEARNMSECAQWNSSLKRYDFPSPDIRSVSYINDGKTLNTTLWLSDKFVKTPLPQNESQLSSGARKGSDKFQEQFTIHIQKLTSNNITLNEYINGSLKSYRESLTANFNLTNFKIMDLNANTTFWNNNAHKLTYSTFSKKYNVDLRVMEIWTMKNDKAFIIRYMAEPAKYSAYLPKIQKMIDSLENSRDLIIQTINGTSNFLLYENPTIGLKILYPSNWTISEEDNIYSDVINFSSPYEEQSLNQTLSSTPFKNFFSPYEEQSLNHTVTSDSDENFFWQGVRYVTVMDINSVYGEGSDYLIQIGWNKFLGHNNWVMRFTEQSLSGGIKVLYEEQNYTDFFVKEGNHILLSFNLTDLNFPEQYRLVSYVDLYYVKNNRLCFLHDPTNHVPFPPPKFHISTLPNSVTLRPGEKKDIQVTLNSTAYSPSEAFFSTKQVEGVNITFTPNKISVPANEMVASNLQLKASNNANEKFDVLPIVATISFPRAVGIKGIDKIFNNTSSERIIENSLLTLTVLPPLTLEERLNIFYDTWLSPISGLWTFMAGIGAVIAPLIISVYRKRSKKDKNKKLSDWFNAK